MRPEFRLLRSVQSCQRSYLDRLWRVVRLVERNRRRQIRMVFGRPRFEDGRTNKLDAYDDILTSVFWRYFIGQWRQGQCEIGTDERHHRFDKKCV